MDDPQRIVKCGNLSLHTAGGFFKKKWHNKYLVLYDGSKSGIKRLELFDSEIKFKKQNAAKIIPLVDCVRVVTCQRNKTTYTFEVRTSEQFYLLAAQSFQDMNDWVNCLRLVAFGEASGAKQPQQGFTVPTKRLQQQQPQHKQSAPVDVLLERRNVPNPGNQAVQSNPAGGAQQQQKITTASQAMTAASSALARTRQRQPSLLGSCKPQPPTDSPFIQQQQQQRQSTSEGVLSSSSPQEPQTLNAIGGQIDTLTPTVRGQLIGAAVRQLAGAGAGAGIGSGNGTGTGAGGERPAPRQTNGRQAAPAASGRAQGKTQQQQRAAGSLAEASLDEAEENMLYCSIEDNPSEHNYRVKVIESELSLRCQLKCYQLTTPNAVSQQYDQIGNFKPASGANQREPAPVIFYQLIIGPQELTLLNDYALGAQQAASPASKQGLWSWPYQCIRRYGFDKDNCFMFEAGRKCTSGPGQFIVQTPKAYSIYQDVVKFVNELRCVSGAAADQQPAGVAQADGSAQQQQPADKWPASAAVTQIPVSWTPEGADSRRHFFDSLRQMGGQHVGQAQSQSQPQQQASPPAPNNGQSLSSASNSSPIARKAIINQPNHPPAHLSHNYHHLMHRNPDTIPELCEHSSASSSASSSSTGPSSPTQKGPAKEGGGGLESAPSLKRPTSGSDVTSEETDESGYEQGDDSVDSSSSRVRSLAAELKSRHSMSSASSTSSSSGGAGSANADAGPLYSVIQRQRPGQQQQQPAPLSRRWPPLKLPETRQRHDLNANPTTRTSNTEKLLSRLMAADEPTARRDQDFEANLMRDVYSEITKLHATFAVTPYSE